MKLLIERLSALTENKEKDCGNMILEFNESFKEMVKTGEFAALMSAFERWYKLKNPMQEPKEMWPRHVYASGPLDEAFQAFLKGYAWGRQVEAQGFK